MPLEEPEVREREQVPEEAKRDRDNEVPEEGVFVVYFFS